MTPSEQLEATWLWKCSLLLANAGAPPADSLLSTSHLRFVIHPRQPLKLVYCLQDDGAKFCSWLHRQIITSKTKLRLIAQLPQDSPFLHVIARIGLRVSGRVHAPTRGNLVLTFEIKNLVTQYNRIPNNVNEKTEFNGRKIVVIKIVPPYSSCWLYTNRTYTHL